MYSKCARERGHVVELARVCGVEKAQSGKCKAQMASLGRWITLGGGDSLAHFMGEGVQQASTRGGRGRPPLATIARPKRAKTLTPERVNGTG